MTDARQKILDSLSDPFVHRIFQVTHNDTGKVLIELDLTLTEHQDKQLDALFRPSWKRKIAPAWLTKALLATGKCEIQYGELCIVNR